MTAPRGGMRRGRSLLALAAGALIRVSSALGGAHWAAAICTNVINNVDVFSASASVGEVQIEFLNP
jgi:hypothetical protein